MFFYNKKLPNGVVQLMKDKCEGVFFLPEVDFNEEIEAGFISKQYLSKNDIIVLDGYHFRTYYQRSLKRKGVKVVCIDDIHAYHFVADAVINHAGGLTKEMYSIENYTELYLGLEFTLLQHPFLQAIKERKYNPANNPIFICLGGADPKNDTLRILKTCETAENVMRCFVVIGAAYSHREELENFITNSRLEVQLLSSLSAKEMVAYMQKCPIAICPPSTISFEYSAVGGLLYLHQIADNQQAIKDYFLKNGFAFSFEDFPITNQDQIQRAQQLQQKYFDGKSPERILNIFKKLTPCYQFAY